jgi:hypothetical protein
LIPFRVPAAYTLTEVALNTQEFRKMMTTPPHIEEDATEFEVHTSCRTLF